MTRDEAIRRAVRAGIPQQVASANAYQILSMLDALEDEARSRHEHIAWRHARELDYQTGSRIAAEIHQEARR